MIEVRALFHSPCQDITRPIFSMPSSQLPVSIDLFSDGIERFSPPPPEFSKRLWLRLSHDHEFLSFFELLAFSFPYYLSQVAYGPLLGHPGNVLHLCPPHLSTPFIDLRRRSDLQTPTPYSPFDQTAAYDKHFSELSSIPGVSHRMLFLCSSRPAPGLTHHPFAPSGARYLFPDNFLPPSHEFFPAVLVPLELITPYSLPLRPFLFVRTTKEHFC